MSRHLVLANNGTSSEGNKRHLINFKFKSTEDSASLMMMMVVVVVVVVVLEEEEEEEEEGVHGLNMIGISK